MKSRARNPGTELHVVIDDQPGTELAVDVVATKQREDFPHESLPLVGAGVLGANLDQVRTTCDQGFGHRAPAGAWHVAGVEDRVETRSVGQAGSHGRNG